MATRVNGDPTFGPLLTLGLARGGTVKPGTWTKVETGQQGSAGLFQLTLATNQSDPDDPDSKQFAMGDSGTPTVSSVSPLSNGRTAFTYTFSAARAAGGTVTGSGTGIISPSYISPFEVHRADPDEPQSVFGVPAKVVW